MKPWDIITRMVVDGLKKRGYRILKVSPRMVSPNDFSCDEQSPYDGPLSELDQETYVVLYTIEKEII